MKDTIPSPGDSKLIEAVKAKLAIAVTEMTGLGTSARRSAFMKAFWDGLSEAERMAWRRYVLGPGHDAWEAGMSAAERLEQRGKISRARLANRELAVEVAIATWARRSSQERAAFGAAVSAANLAVWAKMTPEERRIRMRGLASVPREVRSARQKVAVARRGRDRRGRLTGTGT